MSNSKVIVEKHEGVTRVTINEEGEWSLLMNDVDGGCVHVRCFGSVSYYLYEDDGGFAYSVSYCLCEDDEGFMRPPTDSSPVVGEFENRS